MNININKILDLLNKNKIQEAKDCLIEALLKSENKKDFNLFKNVKKYIKQVDKYRPNLQGVLWKEGKQFIIDGITAFIFDEYVEAFEELLNFRDEDQNIDVFKIFITIYGYEDITEKDEIIIKNIDKYISFYKSIDMEDKTPFVYFNNKVFNANVLKTVVGIMGDELKYTKSEPLHPTQFKTKNITGLALPIRIKEQKDIDKIKEITYKFIETIKEINNGKC